MSAPLEALVKETRIAINTYLDKAIEDVEKDASVAEQAALRTRNSLLEAHYRRLRDLHRR